MEQDIVYSHQGVTYARDWYTGVITTLEAKIAASAASAAAYYATAKGKQELIDLKAEQAAAAAEFRTREAARKERELKLNPIEQQVIEAAKILIKSATITSSSYEEWCIRPWLPLESYFA